MDFAIGLVNSILNLPKWPVNRLSVWGKGIKIARREKGKGTTLFLPSPHDFFTPSQNREPVHRLCPRGKRIFVENSNYRRTVVSAAYQNILGASERLLG